MCLLKFQISNEIDIFYRMKSEVKKTTNEEDDEADSILSEIEEEQVRFEFLIQQLFHLYMSCVTEPAFRFSSC